MGDQGKILSDRFVNNCIFSTLRVVTLDERPWGARSKSSRNSEERSLQETFHQSLEIPAHRRNPQRDGIKLSDRPIVLTGANKNKQRKLPDTTPLSCSRLYAPVRHFPPTSSTQPSEKSSSHTPDLTSPPHLPIQNEITSSLMRPEGSLAADAVEYEHSSPPPSYEVTEWTAFLDRVQRDPSSATYEVRSSPSSRSFERLNAHRIYSSWRR